MKSILEVGNLKSNGHYAFATIHQNTVYVSGQFAINPETREKEFGPIEEETLQALKNVEMIVEAAGSKKEKILRMTLYISDIELWDKVDAVYTEFLVNINRHVLLYQRMNYILVSKLKLMRFLIFRIFFCPCYIKKYISYKKLFKGADD
ncbi:hypothetical protein BSAF29S_02022 [Bacillus safensis subsp. safensis]